MVTTSGKPSKPKANEAPAPDVERGDHIFFRTPKGPATGKVLARGKHGVTLDHEGKRRTVRWDDIHGHKSKVQSSVRVVDQGEDGLIVEDEGGQRRFVRDPLNPTPEDPHMAKSLMPVVLLFGRSNDLLKAAGAPPRPGLQLKKITDKTGKQTSVWVKTGDKVAYPHPTGGHPTTGTVVGDPGTDGAHVDEHGTGQQHQVLHADMEKPTSEKGGGSGAPPPPSDPKDFSAAAYGAATDDSDVTPESILKQFPPETADRIREAEQKLAVRGETIQKLKKDGEWLDERRKLHDQILFTGFTDSKGKPHKGLLSPEAVAAARPAPGQKPTFTVLGGRGGSGKSWFAGKVYDESRAIVLDADEIKNMLPEYEGWNANEVHEESGELFEEVTGIARKLGLNVVHDATMKNGDKAETLVDAFKDSGYRVETHYMHLPRQESAKRAVSRFMTDKNNGSGRYVPLPVLLGMKSNEASFDRIKGKADKWSFRDNNVPRGEEPKVVSEGGSDDGADGPSKRSAR
jgi:predicted kinase